MPEDLAPGTPAEVVERAKAGPRVPRFDAALGREVTVGDGRARKHRLVVIGDSLTHGFQSGAIYRTELAYGAIVAHELGWDGFRFPRYGGPGGLPVNIEYILRDLERRFGEAIDPWELPAALLRARAVMDEIEDYWERGAGARPPADAEIQHAQAVFGYDLRDALVRNAERSERVIKTPNDDPFDQIVEHYRPRAALHVHPRADDAAKRMTFLDAARALGADGGIETLVVFLGSNNALGAVTDLKLAWSGDDFRDLAAKNAYTVWRPSHFAAEFAELEAQVARIDARHVIWATVPHVTIAPLARGVGSKLAPRSRYFPYYTRPWISDDDFDPRDDPHLTGPQARAIDYAIDAYNDTIQASVARARGAGRDWYLLEIAGMLDRLAHRRFIEDESARPPWWTPWPLPPALRALRPPPDSRFLTGDGKGGRASGGWFSLDGVHPTTVGYGLIAQEVIDIMRLAGVEFPGDGRVDFERLIARDTLIEHPPQNLRPGLKTLAWGDDALDWITRIFTSR